MPESAPSTSPTNNPAVAPRTRLHEIDFLRGLAIVLMSSFHFVFDLSNYFNFNLDTSQGFWFYVGRTSAILFMIISGLSATLGKKPFRRAFVVLAGALLVTVASYFVMGDYYIRFGILHFFAVAMLGKALVDKLIKNPTARLVIAATLVPLSFWLGGVVSTVFVSHPFFLPLGIRYLGFASFDYYPMFPWLAYFCIGVVLGLLVYKNKRSLLSYFKKNNPPKNDRPPLVMRPLAFLGRHSMLVYILHQPLFLGLLFGLSALGLF